jgi:shikimate dehydrogenase
VAFGIHKHNGHLIITNRSRDKGRALADAYGADFVPMDRIKHLRPDIVINTTSMGMTPRENELSCPADCLTPATLVMDVVYTPLETRLLEAARQKGCRVVDGLTMFIAQAAAQFELWTGICPDTKKMRQAVLTRSDRQDL